MKIKTYRLTIDVKHHNNYLTGSLSLEATYCNITVKNHSIVIAYTSTLYTKLKQCHITENTPHQLQTINFTEKMSHIYTIKLPNYTLNIINIVNLSILIHKTKQHLYAATVQRNVIKLMKRI